MRKLFLLLLPLLSLAAFGQSVITIPMQQCVWHSGDNPAWAAQNLDESAWLPFDTLKPNSNHMKEAHIPRAHFWVRCHADLTPLRALDHPALQVANWLSAYQVFLNGNAIGVAGNLRTAVYSMNNIRQYPVPVSILGNQPDTIAFRVAAKLFDVPTPELTAGNSDALNARRASLVLAHSESALTPMLLYFVIGIVGLMLLGLFYYDRSRRELLYLSITCVCIAALRANEFCAAAHFNYSSNLYRAVVFLANLVSTVTNLLFFFTLARRRVPPLYWVALAFVWAQIMVGVFELFLSPQNVWFLFDLLDRPMTYYAPLARIGFIVGTTAPIVAFWPWRRISRRMRPLATLCGLWGAAQFAWFTLQLTSDPRLGLTDYFALWRPELLEMLALVTTFVILALLALLFHDQRQVAEERAVLAGEMLAARDIQRMLAPATLDSAPGFHIEVAFHPMRDVGGDFYLCRVLDNGVQRLLVGDVSGKGTAAAMTAAVLIGAAEERGANSPSELLRHLNRVFRKSKLTGFATCLCADIAPDGTVTLANAGHLSPYYRGEEITLEPGLPIGMNPDTANGYLQSSFPIAPGEKLTFLSDGVVEARSSTGELFGFDRAHAISKQSAQQIASTAQAFGQEDDITVLTLAFAPAKVAIA